MREVTDLDDAFAAMAARPVGTFAKKWNLATKGEDAMSSKFCRRAVSLLLFGFLALAHAFGEKFFSTQTGV